MSVTNREAVEKLETLRRLCDASGQPFYVEILDEALVALSRTPPPSDEATVERVARAIAKRLNITPFERMPWSEQSAYLDTAKDALAALNQPEQEI